MSKQINSFMTDMRLALAFNPMRDPNETVNRAGRAMKAQGTYKGTDCEAHVEGAANHPKAYIVLKPGIEVHKQMVGV